MPVVKNNPNMRRVYPEEYNSTSDSSASRDAERVFGASMSDIGEMNKKVIESREAALSGDDPSSTRIKEGANFQTRSAQATKSAQGGGNLSVGERAQIKRSAESDAGQAGYTNKQTALDKFSNTAGNLASNTLGLIYGDEAANVQQPNASGLTVICTELHMQGYISDNLYEADYDYGVEIRKDAPHVYDGYMVWAPSVVKLMRRSSLFTSFIAFFGVAWAKDMGGEKSKLGYIVNLIGEPICGMIGKIFGGNCGKAIHTA